MAERRLDRLAAPRLFELGQRRAGERQRVRTELGDDELLACRLVGYRLLEERASERPELVQRRDLLLRDRDRVAQPRPARERLEPGGQVVERELAQVAAVHPAQLLLVEDRGRLGDLFEREASLQLLGGEERRLLVIAPAEQGEVVAHGLGQVAAVAQLLHGGGAVALRELLAVRAVQQWQVRVHRGGGAHRLLDQYVLGRVAVVVGATHDVRDGGVVVVDDDREVVDRRAVGARDHEVVLERVLELRLVPDHVDHGGRALVGHAQPHGSLALVGAAEAAVVVGVPVGLDLVRTRRGAVGVPAGQQLLDDLGVPLGAARLEDRLGVPVDPEPPQRLEDLLDVLGRGALAVGVLDPQHQLSPPAAREQPVVERGAGAADVQGAGRRGSEADAHGRGSMLEPPVPMLIGVHVSPAGGPAKAVARGVERGARSIQIFNQNPRQWKPREYSDEEVADFRSAMAGSDVDALLIHAVYLLNPASEEADFRDKTLASLTTSLRAGAALGASAVVLHPGSALKGGVDTALDRAGKVIAEALAESEDCPLHLENTAGAGGTLGRSFEELTRLLGVAGGHERLSVCLDSCHLLASGYDIRSADGLAAVLDEFDDIVGLRRLGSLHVNDSATPLGSNRDRHINLGDGELGRTGCAAFLSEPRFDGLPCVLEGPGAKGKGVDRDDMADAFRLREEGLAARG